MSSNKENEMHRCEDCKSLTEFNFNSNVGFRCRKGHDIPRFDLTEWQFCSGFKRLWWKFWAKSTN